jgi:hypothetical protein
MLGLIALDGPPAPAYKPGSNSGEAAMGAWGVDAFGNDDACDWAYGLEEVEDLSLVEEALDAVLAADGYLEAPEGAAALAAAEVVARLQGHWGARSAYSETADKWVERTRLKPSPELAAKARRAIARILGGESELAELWQESEEQEAWVASVRELEGRVHV